MAKARLALPSKLAREIRQSCGFGCAICGKMPTDYAHIVPYRKREEHKFENLILLCKTHHNDFDNKRISKSQIRKYKERPYCLSQGTSNFGFLHKPINKLNIGSTKLISRFDAVFNLISIRNQVIFKIEIKNGTPFFSFYIHDLSGKISLVVIENTIQFSKTNYDVILVGNHLKVNWKSRHILFDAVIDEGILRINKLRFFYGGTAILINDGKIHVNSGLDEAGIGCNLDIGNGTVLIDNGMCNVIGTQNTEGGVNYRLPHDKGHLDAIGAKRFLFS